MWVVDALAAATVAGTAAATVTTQASSQALLEMKYIWPCF